MLIFSYGANVNTDYLNTFIDYKFIDTGILYDYQIIFNHFGLYGNIKKNNGYKVYGTIIEINDINFKKLKKKEFMYNIIKLNIFTSKNKNIECYVFKSKFELSELGITNNYRNKIIKGYKRYNLPIPNFKKKFNYQSFKLFINTLGFLFGLYLFYFTNMKTIGLTLFFVDFTMVIDQLFNKTYFYNNLSYKYPQIFFIFYKIIPLFFAVNIINNSNKFLKFSGIIFLIVDILVLIKYYLENFI